MFLWCLVAESTFQHLVIFCQECLDKTNTGRQCTAKNSIPGTWYAAMDPTLAKTITDMHTLPLCCKTALTIIKHFLE